MAPNKVIVFGPTGGVGSVAARYAQELGAKVYLAMRDRTKPIPGVSAEQEAAGGYERVQADLTHPESITAAVAQTGAKRAFIYYVHGVADGLKGAITALKAAGIEFVVFLSSGSIQGDIRAIQPAAVIPYTHAQVEINLEAIYGAGGFAAVRPGFFATNSLRLKKGILRGDAEILYPDVKFDYISPVDMGRVAGRLLAQGWPSGEPPAGQHHVYINGPTLLTQRQAAETIAQTLGRPLTVTAVDEAKGIQNFVEDDGFPRPLATSFAHGLKMMSEAQKASDAGDGSAQAEAVDNIRKYGEHEPTPFANWVVENKHLFSDA